MKKVKADNWKLKILKTDRNEVRTHIITGTITVLYKDKAGLELAYRWAKQFSKSAMLSIADEYRKLKTQGA